jgi:hypothetical protein
MEKHPFPEYIVEQLESLAEAISDGENLFVPADQLEQLIKVCREADVEIKRLGGSPWAMDHLYTMGIIKRPN